MAVVKSLSVGAFFSHSIVDIFSENQNLEFSVNFQDF
jgi:hypothetical protein